MHFTSSLFLVLYSLLIAVSLAVAMPAPQEDSTIAARADLLSRDGEGHLEKRTCYKTGCKCRKGFKQGLYCGLCMDKNYKYFTVSNWGTHVGTAEFKESVYECSPEGDCCNYGYRKSCAENNTPCVSI
jgi:hypothetical protein